MEAEDGQGFPHAGQRAAVRGHRGHEPTVNSTVEEPNLGRVRRFINAEREMERERHSEYKLSGKKQNIILLGF